MWNRWPVQVWCMKQGTQGWCSGTTQRGIGYGGRWEGGLGRGRHTYTCGWFMLMWNKTHHNIVISLQLKKLTEKKHSWRTSLAVQWLRLCDSIAGGMGLIPGQGTKILHAMCHGQNTKTKEIYSWASLFMGSVSATLSACWNASITQESILWMLSWSFTETVQKILSSEFHWSSSG